MQRGSFGDIALNTNASPLRTEIFNSFFPNSNLMKSIKLFILLTAVLLLCSCGGGKGKKSYDKVGLDGLTERTENLRDNLRTYVSKGVMVGQMYGTIEGIGWKNDSARSDIYEITNDRPAVTGYRLDGIESGAEVNTDSLRFSDIRKNVIDYFHRNGLILMSWAMPEETDDDKQIDLWTQELAKYFDSLQDQYGIKAPVVLFINPLRDNAWYGNLSKDDYEDLFEKVTDALKDKDVTNVIYGYSEEWNGKQLRGYYPDGISIINLTYLQSAANANGSEYTATLDRLLPQLTSAASDNNAVVGLTTGIEGLPDSTFFSSRLLPCLHKNHLSYVMFGPNHGDFNAGHYYVPYPGISNDRIHDFTSFYNDPQTVFLSDLNGLYLKH